VAVDGVLATAMATDPEQRYDSAREFHNALTDTLE